MSESFEEMLTGGHPNSLGNTIQVVNQILKDNSKLEELFRCYSSKDEVVRLRTSNAFKRIAREKPDWVVPFIDRFISEIGNLNQASAQWTLAQLFLELQDKMSKTQKDEAIKIMKRNLVGNKDWIVQNQTIQTLGEWSKSDINLKEWLIPNLEKITKDPHKSVARKAQKILDLISK